MTNKLENQSSDSSRGVGEESGETGDDDYDGEGGGYNLFELAMSASLLWEGWVEVLC